MAAAPFLAVDHPAIACRDTRRQIDWYCRLLGMRVVARNDADPPTALVGYDADAKHGAVIELMFPGIYGGSLIVVGVEAFMLAAYLALAWMAARERPP